MDSGREGVPLTAAQVAPMAAPLTSGIRAPLTVDESDFEYSVSSKSRRNSMASSHYSNSELEYEGFEDEEIHEEENHFFHEYDFYEPSVVKTNGEMARESSFRRGYGFPRPAVRYTDEKFAQGSDNVNRDVFVRPLVGIPDEEFAPKSGGVDGNLFLTAFVGNPDERTGKVVSNVNDSDDSRSFLSESGDEFVENENFVLDSGSSRPLVGVMNEENLENGPPQVLDINVPFVQKWQVPIAKISGDSDDDDSQGSEFSEDKGVLAIARVPSFEVLSRLNSAPKVRMSETDEGDDNESLGENMVEMEVVEDLAVSKGVLGDEDEIERVDGTDSVKCVISSDTVQYIGVDVSKEEKANSLTANEQYNPVPESGQIGDVVHLDEEIKEIDVTDDQKECVDLTKNSNSGLEDNLVLNHDVVSEKLESDGEIEIEQPIIESSGYIDAQKITFLQERVDIEDMSDSHLDDASLTGEETYHTVFEVAKLDQETTKEAENHEELPDEVEYSTLHAETNAVVAVSEKVPDSMVKVQDSSEESVMDNFKAVKGVVSDYCAVKPESVDGTEDFSPDRNSADLASVFGSAGPVIESQVRDEALSGKEKLRQLSFAEATTSSSQALFLDSSRTEVLELDAREKGDLNFSLCILVIGKTGVGKSATINSIFGESKAAVNAFEPSTNRVKEIIGMIDGVKVKVFDTPGFRISPIEQSFNRKILSSIKKLMRKSPPDVILYVDRLDTQSSNFNDLPLLKLVTSYLGSSIWQKTILTFTHANLLPPDGPDGYPLSYEEFIAQQSRAIQQLINQSWAVQSLVTNDDSMIPVSLIENHPFAEKNANGEDTLNGEKWRSKLLFLCYSMKILLESSSLVEIRNPTDRLKLFILRWSFLDPSCQILTRPVFDSALIEDFGITSHSPAVITVQLTKDKKAFDIQLCSLRGDKGSNDKKISYIRHTGDLGVNVSAGFNENLSGRIYVKTRCSDQIQLAALAFFPIARAVFDKYFGQSVTED